MKNEINAVLENMTTTAPEPEDYTGEDGLLYCGKCRKPKEAYFAPDKAAIFGRDRHPAECDCQRAAREEREAAEKRRRHLDTVEELKRRGFTDPTMRDWTFENDNGRNPQTAVARFYGNRDIRIGCIKFLHHRIHYFLGAFIPVCENKGKLCRLCHNRTCAFSLFCLCGLCPRFCRQGSRCAFRPLPHCFLLPPFLPMYCFRTLPAWLPSCSL